MIALDDEGDGPPLVLVHGLATTRTIWRRAIPLLRGRRRIVSLDVPGFGESPAVAPLTVGPFGAHRPPAR